jgi:hypothetical protein
VDDSGIAGMDEDEHGTDRKINVFSSLGAESKGM